MSWFTCRSDFFFCFDVYIFVWKSLAGAMICSFSLIVSLYPCCVLVQKSHVEISSWRWSVYRLFILHWYWSIAVTSHLSDTKFLKWSNYSKCHSRKSLKQINFVVSLCPTTKMRKASEDGGCAYAHTAHCVLLHSTRTCFSGTGFFPPKMIFDSILGFLFDKQNKSSLLRLYFFPFNYGNTNTNRRLNKKFRALLGFVSNSITIEHQGFWSLWFASVGMLIDSLHLISLSFVDLCSCRFHITLCVRCWVHKYTKK